MFNKDFFPTPQAIIRKMIEPFRDKIGKCSILDPSAGSGDILDYLVNSHLVNQKDVYCIEQEPELKMILQQKGYKVLGDDFLKYSGNNHFNLILMNPPFSKGDEHFLKAWDVVKNGHIVCLLNSETLENPYSEKRKLIQKLIADNGATVENLGQCFTTAKRKTDVNVSMVTIHKKAENKFKFNFDSLGKEKGFKIDEETLKNPIAVRDVIGNMIVRFEHLQEAFIQYMKVKAEMEYYVEGLLPARKSLTGIINDAVTGRPASRAQKFNRFSDLMRNEIWQVVMDKIDIQQFMTYSVRETFDKFRETQGAADFTRENVQQLITLLYENKGSILDKAVVDVFDFCTTYYKENRVYVEGWKTNDRWKVNRKVILPNVITPSCGGYFDVSHYGGGTYRKFEDIDKVMCYLSGKHYSDFNKLVEEYEYRTPDRDKIYKMLSIEQGIKRYKIGRTEKLETEFFWIRCYKKGTIHLEFKDKYLWQEFNMRACAGKQWLPEAEKKAWQEATNRIKIAA